MALTTVSKVGAFTDDVATQINDNFTSLAGTSAGGALTSGHILVGNGSNISTDVAITGVLAITNAGVTTLTGGATAGPFTTVASIQVVGGVVTVLTGS